MINKNNIKNYIRNKKNMMTKTMISGMYVMIKDPLPKHIDIEKIVEHISSKLPDHVLSLVDVLYIGDFEFLNKKNVNATFLENAIYATNNQTDQKDLLDDILHEFSHAVEKDYDYVIYADGAIEGEFLNKRHKLEVLLDYEGYATDEYNFSNPNFDSSFDKLLHDEIGYEKLMSLSQGMFIGSYSVTSLSEYFATSFEEYYLKNRKLVQRITPAVYDKLEIIHKGEMEVYDGTSNNY